MNRCRSTSIVINADPATVFDVLADPAQHGLFDGSNTVKGQLSGPPRLYLGATFSMRMHMVAPYLIRSRVVEYEEDRKLAWRHPMRHIWRYELEPVDGGTRVRESWDISQEVVKVLVKPARGKTIKAMNDTLERIEKLLAAEPA